MGFSLNNGILIAYDGVFFFFFTLMKLPCALGRNKGFDGVPHNFQGLTLLALTPSESMD